MARWPTALMIVGTVGCEHLLAITGMIFGVIAAGTQAVELWQILRDLYQS